MTINNEVIGYKDTLVYNCNSCYNQYFSVMGGEVDMSDSSIFKYSLPNYSKNFYNKIFVNAAGDSFLGAVCRLPKQLTRCCSKDRYGHSVDCHDDLNLIQASDFSDMYKYKTILMEGGKRPIGCPGTELQYYFTKDSIAFSSFFYTYTKEMKDTVTRITYLEVLYGNKIR